MALGAGLILAITLAGSPPAQAARHHRPDLIVTDAGLQSQGVFWAIGLAHPVDLTWHHRTENDGRGPAAKSVTGLSLVNRDGAVRLARLRVPALAPSQTHKGRGTFPETFDETWDFGTYEPKVCADITHKVAESDEANNCMVAHPFYIVPFKFEGTVSGTAPLSTTLEPGVSVGWSGTVHGDIAKAGMSTAANDGIFDYEFFSGSVTYTVKGTNTVTGCTWSGTGTYNPATFGSALNLQFGRDSHYSASDVVAPTFNFPVTITCPDGSGTSPFSPSVFGLGKWLDTGPNPWAFPDPGVSLLNNHYTDKRAQGATSYVWSLKAMGG